MHKIAVIAGDGIGPEVVREGLKVLAHAASVGGFQYELVHYPFSAEHYLKTNETMPAAALEEMRQLSAIYLGAIGDPRLPAGFLERAIIATLRFDLDLYVNLRPVSLFAEHLTPLKGKTPADIDMVVVRENTEDIYLGVGGFVRQGTPDEIAIMDVVYTRRGVERIIRYAFELCRARNRRKKLTLVDKANAIKAHDLWRRTFAEVGKEYPDVTTDAAYVDAAAMWMVKNPEWFDVMVTTNMFGDILTDLGAMLQGGMGVAASGNIHPGRVSLFEPIHGSAPKHAGKNEANPLGAIMAVQMMLDYLGEKEPAALIERAVRHLLSTGEITDVSAQSGLPTDRVGDMVVAAMGKVEALHG
ncbi:MAG TPA: 3-isopropylmalate dehydrogenase [Candidatus Xenobia bacterium]|jgi:3-isopropylmalate dehydrogenase